MAEQNGKEAEMKLTSQGWSQRAARLLASQPVIESETDSKIAAAERDANEDWELMERQLESRGVY
jgi:hypothetical protein